jgi:two-component system sensor histidine kinase and response regulator WspE
MSTPRDLEDLSMEELFRLEAETHTGALTGGLLALERGGGTPAQLEELMRAAHSLKGAARIMGHEAAVEVAHVMEDCFVAAQEGELQLGAAEVDVLLGGVDLLARMTTTSEEVAGKDDFIARASGFPRGAAGSAASEEVNGSCEAPLVAGDAAPQKIGASRFGGNSAGAAEPPVAAALSRIFGVAGAVLTQ